jgi:DNA repair protein RadC
MYVRSGHRYRAAKGVEVLEAAAFFAGQQIEARRVRLDSPSTTEQFLMEQLSPSQEECFSIVFLDSRQRVIAFEKMFRGTIDGAHVHPRVIVREVLDRNAAAVILAHNHPSGEVDPSQHDEGITRKVKQALDLIDVRVLDHIIIGAYSCFSFAKNGLL